MTVSTLDLYNITNLEPFQVYNDDFMSILGSTPQLTNILNSSNSSFPQFHEAGIFFSEDPNPVLFITSNQYNKSDSPATNNQQIAISRIEFDGQRWSSSIVTPTEAQIVLANGGTKYKDAIVILDQGSLTTPGGLVYMNATPPYASKVLINNYLGAEFNSPNDVFATRDGALWFTDPDYGSWQGIRPAPTLPTQVYRYVPDTNDIRVVADGFVEPNGITFSPDENTVYITDGAGNSSVPQNSRAIYAFDVLSRNGEPYLTNKRIFATSQVGIPDGIKVDVSGNVYAGCGDGINVWNSGGKLLGKIVVDGGSANFVLGTKGQVWLLNEDKLWLASLNAMLGIVNR